MKLYVSPRAPNPRRVTVFLAEKGIRGIELHAVDLNGQQHLGEAYKALSPLGKVPTLVLDDGRALGESRAICTYLEGLHPEPNLMGRDASERAFIEMADRRVEFYLMGTVAACVRHTHPGLAALEQPQFADYGRAQGAKLGPVVQWLDGLLAAQPYVAGERFTVADITAYVALDFARLMKFNPGEAGLPHLHAYWERWRERPSSRVL